MPSFKARKVGSETWRAMVLTHKGYRAVCNLAGYPIAYASRDAAIAAGLLWQEGIGAIRG